MNDTTETKVKRYKKVLEHLFSKRDPVMQQMIVLRKLYSIDEIGFHVLQVTGIGKTVNRLRHERAPVGIFAKALVDKWKDKVIIEIEDDEGTSASDVLPEDNGDAEDVVPINDDQNDDKFDETEKGIEVTKKNEVISEVALEVKIETGNIETDKKDCCEKDDKPLKVSDDLEPKNEKLVPYESDVSLKELEKQPVNQASQQYSFQSLRKLKRPRGSTASSSAVDSNRSAIDERSSFSKGDDKGTKVHTDHKIKLKTSAKPNDGTYDPNTLLFPKKPLTKRKVMMYPAPKIGEKLVLPIEMTQPVKFQKTEILYDIDNKGDVDFRYPNLPVSSSKKGTPKTSEVSSGEKRRKKLERPKPVLPTEESKPNCANYVTDWLDKHEKYILCGNNSPSPEKRLAIRTKPEKAKKEKKKHKSKVKVKNIEVQVELDHHGGTHKQTGDALNKPVADISETVNESLPKERTVVMNDETLSSKVCGDSGLKDDSGATVPKEVIERDKVKKELSIPPVEDEPADEGISGADNGHRPSKVVSMDDQPRAGAGDSPALNDILKGEDKSHLGVGEAAEPRMKIEKLYESLDERLNNSQFSTVMSISLDAGTLSEVAGGEEPAVAPIATGKTQEDNASSFSVGSSVSFEASAERRAKVDNVKSSLVGPHLSCKNKSQDEVTDGGEAAGVVRVNTTEKGPLESGASSISVGSSVSFDASAAHGAKIGDVSFLSSHPSRKDKSPGDILTNDFIAISKPVLRPAERRPPMSSGKTKISLQEYLKLRRQAPSSESKDAPPATEQPKDSFRFGERSKTVSPVKEFTDESESISHKLAVYQQIANKVEELSKMMEQPKPSLPLPTTRQKTKPAVDEVLKKPEPSPNAMPLVENARRTPDERPKPVERRTKPHYQDPPALVSQHRKESRQRMKQEMAKKASELESNKILTFSDMLEYNADVNVLSKLGSKKPRKKPHPPSDPRNQLSSPSKKYKMDGQHEMEDSPVVSDVSDLIEKRPDMTPASRTPVVKHESRSAPVKRSNETPEQRTERHRKRRELATTPTAVVSQEAKRGGSHPVSKRAHRETPEQRDERHRKRFLHEQRKLARERIERSKRTRASSSSASEKVPLFESPDIVASLSSNPTKSHPSSDAQKRSLKPAHSRRPVAPFANDTDEIVARKIYTKTKVFAGKRRVNDDTVEVPKLFDLCMRVLIHNINSIEYVGGIPAHVLFPLLRRCTASQLYTLEHYNSHFIGETDYLWEAHFKREFKGCELEENLTWRDRYVKLFEERRHKLKNVKDSISHRIQKRQEVEKTTKLAFVGEHAKPPREIRRKAQKALAAMASTPSVTPKDRDRVRTKARPSKRSSSSSPAKLDSFNSKRGPSQFVVLPSSIAKAKSLLQARKKGPVLRT